MLNEKKNQNLVFNFTKEHQFTSEVLLKNEKLETVDKTKLLGVIITNDLKWHENTKHIVKNANMKMRMLHKFSKEQSFFFILLLFKKTLSQCLSLDSL